MKQFTFVVQAENGIHARPAGLLVKEAQKYKSEISISCNGKSADVKRLFALLGLAAQKGDKLTVSVKGDDEALAAKSFEQYLKENF